AADGPVHGQPKEARAVNGTGDEEKQEPRRRHGCKALRPVIARKPPRAWCRPPGGGRESFPPPLTRFLLRGTNRLAAALAAIPLTARSVPHAPRSSQSLGNGKLVEPALGRRCARFANSGWASKQTMTAAQRGYIHFK